MPEWLWSIIVGVVVVGLVAALRNADRERMARIEQWIRDKEKQDRDWRHDEYSPKVTELNLNVCVLQTKMERVERFLNGALRKDSER